MHSTYFVLCPFNVFMTSSKFMYMGGVLGVMSFIADLPHFTISSVASRSDIAVFPSSRFGVRM